MNTNQTLNVMKKASKVASGRSLMPIFNHVAITLKDGKCSLTASDGTRSYSETFEAYGDDGECTLESVKLNRSLAGLKSGEIEITEKGVKQGKTNIKLESMNYDMYPLPEIEKTQETPIDSNELFSIFSMISHAMPTKDVRLMLNGIHLTNGYAVATDGHRMAFVECGYNGSDIIIPADTVRSMPDVHGQVHTSEAKLVIENENSVFSTALIDAKFPDWKRIIPKEHSIEIKADKLDLVNAIKTVQIGGDIIKLSISKDLMNIKNDGAETEIQIESTGDLEIGFMSQYILDALNQCLDGEIVIKLGENKACSINDNYIVMPVRI